MSRRREFLNSFKVISNKYSSNICLYFVSDAENSSGVTYFELNRLSDELSLFFSQIFGENQEYIGVSLSENFLLPSIILSIWKSGNIFAGIGTQYSIQNSLNFLNFLQIKYLISDNNNEPFNYKFKNEFCIYNQSFYIWERDVQNEKEKPLEDICYGIMTSGTTGNIKIIQVPWSCILPNAKELSEEFGVSNSDCIFQGSPCTFDPFFIELFLVLLNGSSMVIVSNNIKLNPTKLLKILFENQNTNNTSDISLTTHFTNKNNLDIKPTERKNITILQMTPSVFKRWSHDEIKVVLSTLKILVLGGEKFPKDILKLKSNKNQTKIFNIYGITEISCWAFLNELTNTPPEEEIPLGKPLKNIVYKISDTNELFIGSMSRKCLIDFEKLIESKEIIYRNTGDIVELKNNSLYYIGRSNQIYKKYGMKINLNKIEEQFKKNITITDCYCIFDEENLKLGLFLVPENKSKFNKNYTNISLDDFKKLGYIYPQEINDIAKPDIFVLVIKPPVNFHGKCDKKKLLEYLKNIYQSSTVTNLRETFFKIWCEALNLGNNDVMCKSFLSLGGSSVTALQIINKLEDFGVSVPQNFISNLLKNGNFEDCLSLLSIDEVPKKKIKLNFENEEILSIKWKFDLQKCVDATPTVILFEGKKRVIIGSHSSKLSCLDSETGSEIWSTFLGDRIESGFTFGKNTTRGYIGCYDNFLYCISVVDGSCIWKYKTGDMIKSTPCISSDGETVYTASYDKHLYCLSSSNGSLIKKIKLSDGGIFSSGIVSGILNLFFIGTLDGTCVSLSQETKEIVWKTKLKSPVFASPCLLHNESEIIFPEVLGIVHCLDSLSGTPVWKYEANGNIYSSPISQKLEDTWVILFGCHDGHLYCLEEKELKWKQQLDSAAFARPSLIATGDELRVCVPTTKGFIYLCQFISGFITSSIQLNGQVFSSPVCSNAKIFVGCRDNYIYSLQLGG